MSDWRRILFAGVGGQGVLSAGRCTRLLEVVLADSLESFAEINRKALLLGQEAT